MKIFRLILSLLLILPLMSCSINKEKLPFKEGDAASKIEYDSKTMDNYLEFFGYLFFQYKNNDIVAFVGENTIQRIEIYKHSIANEKNYRKLSKGMDVYEVVKLLGLPQKIDYNEANLKKFCLIFERKD